MEKENNKNNLREEKRNNFFALLEDKLIEFGKVALKNGATAFVKNKIKEAEEKIESEIREKLLGFKKNFLQFLFLTVGFLFVAYGGFLLLMEKLELSEYSNIIFGILFLSAFLILKLRK
jgi:hypothetical protein